MSTAWPINQRFHPEYETSELSTDYEVVDPSDQKSYFDKSRALFQKTVDNFQRRILRDSEQLIATDLSSVASTVESPVGDHESQKKQHLESLVEELIEAIERTDSTGVTHQELWEQLGVQIASRSTFGKVNAFVERLQRVLNPLDITTFTNELIELDCEESINTALDLAFDRIDDAFLEGRFDWVDSFLEQVEVDRLSVELIVGVLTITASAEDKLRHRGKFRSQAEAVIKQRGRYNDQILRDL